MNQAVHQQIVSLIWGVADDVLRDLYNRGKYRDVIKCSCWSPDDMMQHIEEINATPVQFPDSDVDGMVCEQ